MEPSATRDKGANMWSDFLPVNSHGLFHISSVLPPFLRHKRTVLERVGRNFGLLRKSSVAKAMTLELHLGHLSIELQIPHRLPGQPLFLLPSRDQPRKRGYIWPAVLPCDHLHVRQVLSTCPVRTLSPATVWVWGQLCSRALWVHCKCCFLMKWHLLLHCLWASPMQNVHSSTIPRSPKLETTKCPLSMKWVSNWMA